MSLKMGIIPSKASIKLRFNAENSNVSVLSTTGTEVISMDDTDDNEIRFVVKGKYASATYVLNVIAAPDVFFFQIVISVFIYDLKCIVREDGNTLITITATRGRDGPRVKFSDIRSTITVGFNMDVIAVEQLFVSEDSKAINFDFESIESAEKTRNINVYVGNDGRTNYYDTAMPIQVTMGVISNLSNSIGDYVINMKLTNGQLDMVTRPSFVVDYKYDDNRISIICVEEWKPVLRVKITKAIEGVPPLLVLVPYYSGKVIFIDFVGTIMRTVPYYSMELSLLVSVG